MISFLKKNCPYVILALLAIIITAIVGIVSTDKYLKPLGRLYAATFAINFLIILFAAYRKEKSKLVIQK